MREIVLDTETTGLSPQEGHRIVEIACLELSRHVPTGQSFHAYLNPEREMPQEARAIHGLSTEFLAPFPRFGEIAEELLRFIGSDPLVIHNAEFDLAFLNAELERLGRPPLGSAIVDTLALARQRFPGAPANLSALCRRFAIDLTDREKHGAVIDCKLLAAVYLELLGGRQRGFDLAAGAGQPLAAAPAQRAPRAHAATAEELARHREMLESLVEPIWLSQE